MPPTKAREVTPVPEALLERLFAAPFSKFIEVRSELARELRAAGDRATADAVAAAKRPTRSAWALNQVARHDASDLAAFLHSVERVREAQRRAVTERDAGAMTEAGRQMNASIARIAKLAIGAITSDGGPASPATERAITGTLRAVPFLEPADLDRLTRGVLVADLEPPDDLALMGSISAGPRDPDPGPTKRSEPRPPVPSPAAAAAAKKREREEAQRERAEAARRAREIEKLERAAVEAEREADRLERRAEAAATRARDAAEEARAARALARTARTTADAASRAPRR